MIRRLIFAAALGAGCAAALWRGLWEFGMMR